MTYDQSNWATLGITIQRFICSHFKISIPKEAQEHFISNYNPEHLSIKMQRTIINAFEDLGIKPQKCVTYTNSKKPGEYYNTDNFILENGKTLSIRTSKANDKIAPRVVGQAGLKTFNYYFDQFTDRYITDKCEIKQVVYDNIHLMLPIFFDYLFTSDYTIWFKVSKDNNVSYSIFDRKQCLDLDFERSNFSFTRDLTAWKESTTLKYRGKSIAEIQIHKNRTFKFRFIMSAVMDFLVTVTKNNETLGISAEKTICDLYNLSFPSHIAERSSESFEIALKPVISEAFNSIPVPIKHTGSEPGIRKAESKCPYDFVLENNLTLSLKTNTGKMVCPPEVGQPSAQTCYLYFKDLCNDTQINEHSFKLMALNNIDKMVPIYISHLFDSDFLLWLYQENESFNYKIFEKDYASNFEWKKENFSFSKPSINIWNESNTVKYNNISIGEFQVHKNRNCYKFRFNFKNLIQTIENV
ncbi:MAG: hypothetical protein IKL68_00900 [Clostridia bacterium]|nr:hypothetical protein [Clostridia bacterium]